MNPSGTVFVLFIDFFERPPDPVDVRSGLRGIFVGISSMFYAARDRTTVMLGVASKNVKFLMIYGQNPSKVRSHFGESLLILLLLSGKSQPTDPWFRMQGSPAVSSRRRIAWQPSPRPWKRSCGIQKVPERSPRSCSCITRRPG